MSDSSRRFLEIYLKRVRAAARVRGDPRPRKHAGGRPLGVRRGESCSAAGRPATGRRLREMAYFQAHLQELLQQHEGQVALVYEDELLGTFSSFEEAFSAAMQRVCNRPVLIRPITRDEAEAQFPALTLGLIG